MTSPAQQPRVAKNLTRADISLEDPGAVSEAKRQSTLSAQDYDDAVALSDDSSVEDDESDDSGISYAEGLVRDAAEIAADGDGDSVILADGDDDKTPAEPPSAPPLPDASTVAPPSEPPPSLPPPKAPAEPAPDPVSMARAAMQDHLGMMDRRMDLPASQPMQPGPPAQDPPLPLPPQGPPQPMAQPSGYQPPQSQGQPTPPRTPPRSPFQQHAVPMPLQSPHQQHSPQPAFPPQHPVLHQQSPLQPLPPHHPSQAPQYEPLQPQGPLQPMMPQSPRQPWPQQSPMQPLPPQHQLPPHVPLPDVYSQYEPMLSQYPPSTRPMPDYSDPEPKSDLSSDMLERMKSLEEDRAKAIRDRQLCEAERDRVVRAEADAAAQHQQAMDQVKAAMDAKDQQLAAQLASKDQQLAQVASVAAQQQQEFANAQAAFQQRIEALESALESRNAQFMQYTNDSQVAHVHQQEVLAEAEQKLLQSEQDAEDRLRKETEKANQYASQIQAMKTRFADELAAEKRHLENTEEVAENRRLNDLADQKSSLQTEHDRQASEQERIARETIQARERAYQEKAATDLAAAAQRLKESELAAKEYHQKEIAKLDSGYKSETKSLQAEFHSEISEQNEYHESRYQQLATDSQVAQQELQHRLDVETEEMKKTVQLLAAKQAELELQEQAAEQQHATDLAETERRLAVEKQAAINAIQRAEEVTKQNLERQYQHKVSLIKQQLEQERQSLHEEMLRSEGKHRRVSAKVRDECAEECERIRMLAHSEQTHIRAKAPKLPSNLGREIARQRLKQAYDGFQKRLKGLCASNGQPFPGVTVRLLAPVNTKSITHPNDGDWLNLVNAVTTALAPHGVTNKDVSVLQFSGTECSVYRPSLRQWESFPSDLVGRQSESRVGCEVRIRGQASVQELGDTLRDQVQVTDGSIRRALSSAGACHLGPFEVEYGWPLQRMEAAVSSRHPDYKIGTEALQRVTRAIAQSTEACRQVLEKVRDGTDADSIKCLIELQSLVCIDGKLSANGSKTDKFTQDAKNFEALIADAKKAHRKLKAALAPLTKWARTDFIGSSDDVDPYFATSPDYLLPKGEIFDPGVQSESLVRHNAAKLQKEYEAEPPWDALTDISRLVVAFDSASDLLTGLDHLTDRFEVLWVTNGFTHPVSIDQCKVSIGIKQNIPQGHISQLDLCLRPVLDFEEGSGQKHVNAIRNVIWGCNVPSDDTDNVLDSIYSAMYQTDAQLLLDANEEVQRLQAEIKRAGINGEEPAALMKACRSYVDALTRETASKPLAIEAPPGAPAPVETSSPTRNLNCRTPGLSDSARTPSPGAFSDATTRSSTPLQYGGKLRATTPQSRGGLRDLQPALTEKRSIGSDGRRALSARTERTHQSNGRSVASAKTRAKGSEGLPQVTA
eukprot:gnl/MRDRNA2_/MRDRNA2_72093_c0_seq1.p1 gnl/MRDRNA2_/MRDRNA2_72093_c0~~gnl/MRDRNA2_/MRDRNA2_72093_c0_seq1.p1  ORF type:complete len:1433 (+),score=351.18 gnl/MRDRNA2_/MRDRNA2_72093_c0_seq1:102-4301(+)